MMESPRERQTTGQSMRKYNGELIHRSRGAAGVIEVVEDPETRSLHFGDATRQSTMYRHQPEVLALSYTRAMLSGLLFRDEPRKVLLIGLGGGSLAKFLLHHFPACHIDAVEPRQDVISVAREFFDLPHSPSLQIHVADGVDFAREAGTERADYDLILVDAYDATGMAGDVSRESFFSDLRSRLAVRGVISANLARPQRDLYREALAALRTAFPHALLRLPVVDKGNEIALALERPSVKSSLRHLETLARNLQERLGLEFPQFLRCLRRDNSWVLSRLLG